MRRTFEQALKEGAVDIKKEYNKLYHLFYEENSRDYRSQAEVISLNFKEYPYRGTCLSLEEFEEYCGYDFKESPDNMDVDYLISFCEFIFNIVFAMDPYFFFGSFDKRDYLNHISTLIEKLGYRSEQHNGLFIFVPKDVAAIEVSQSSFIPDEAAYRVLEYNHHSLKGDIERKKQILLMFSNQLEPHRKEIEWFNKNLESDIFYIFNNYQIRHNNKDPQLKKQYNKKAADMSEYELEEVYDDLYRMCLLAFLCLEQNERHEKITGMK